MGSKLLLLAPCYADRGFQRKINESQKSSSEKLNITTYLLLECFAKVCYSFHRMIKYTSIQSSFPLRSRYLRRKTCTRGTEFKDSELKKYIYSVKTESLSPSFILFSMMKSFRGYGTHVPSARGGDSLLADKWPQYASVFQGCYLIIML